MQYGYNRCRNVDEVENTVGAFSWLPRLFEWRVPVPGFVAIDGRV
jgi:hypothetical protein